MAVNFWIALAQIAELGLCVTVIGVGEELTVIATVDVDDVQLPLEIVQVSVYVPAPPAGVNTADGFAVLLNWAADVLGPLATDHTPVPTVGVLAARVAELTATPLQMVC